jgi:aminomethyltransferase
VTEPDPKPKPKRTPLYDEHCRLGARMVDFAGYSMPVQYAGIKQEHAAVRERAGLFDVSHMGQIQLQGATATETLERLLTCRVSTLGERRVRYGLLCNEAGGCVDDVTVYREASDRYFLCVNAVNIEKDHAWISQHAKPDAGVENRSDERGMLALQGPRSRDVLARLISAADEAGVATLDALPRFGFDTIRLAGADVLVSSTGYTGSPGYELYLPAGDTRGVYLALLEAGEVDGLEPAGLGARDTLRLEAALALYGHELDDTTSPLEAGLERFVKRKQGGFIGCEAIEARERAGRSRQLIGFEMVGKGIGRADHGILSNGVRVGRVTSGAPSPSLGKSIGLGYVPPRLAEPGSGIEIEIRGKPVAARVVATPFEHST